MMTSGIAARAEGWETMRMLLMNTCGTEGVVALADTTLEKAIVVEERLPGRSSSETLMPAIMRLFRGAGWSSGELGAVVVVLGPGSFTGVRVGLSAAKGLCEACGAGMIALSRLALVAEAACPDAGEKVLALLDAGRNEFYSGLYRDGVCREERLIAREEAVALASGVAAVGTCELRVVEALPALAVRMTPEPMPDALLRAALARIGRGEWTDVASVDANYLRRTDAEVLADRKHAGTAV